MKRTYPFILFLFCFIIFILPLKTYAQTGLFPSLPQISFGADYGTIFTEEDDEEWYEYQIIKVYAKLTQEIYKGIFYIAEGYYASYDYSLDNLDKNVYAINNYIRIKTIPSIIINIVFSYKENKYVSPTRTDFSFFKIGANFKYRFTNYSYFYLSYYYYNRNSALDYNLHYIYLNLTMPIWLFNFSIYSLFNYKIYSDLTNSFKYKVGFDITLDLNYLVKE